MKSLVFILVLANLLFYAYTEGYFGRPDNPDAGREQQQLKADQVRVVSRGEPPAKGEAKKEEKAEKADKAEEAPKEAKAADVCLVWNGLAGKDADRLAALLTERFEGFKATRRAVVAEASSWWVFIPPLPGKPEADKKAGELQRLGVTDYFIVNDAGPNRFAISLGIFSSEAGANERLSKLKEKGVRSARVGPRNGKETTYSVEVRGPAASQAAVTESAASLLPESRAETCP